MKINQIIFLKIGTFIALAFILVFLFKNNHFIKKTNNNLIVNDPVTNLWQTDTDNVTGISIKYPEDLGTKYINPVVWPPKISVVDESFDCIETGSEINSTGKTEKKIINGHGINTILMTINYFLFCLTRTINFTSSFYTIK